MKRIVFLVSAAALSASIGCGGAASVGEPPARDASGQAVRDSSGNQVNAAAAGKFKAGLDALAQHDRARDWTQESCSATAQLFLDAAKEQGDKGLAEALYNAGLAYQRCSNSGEAKQYFQQALQKDAKFHRARVQLALQNLAESGDRNLDQAISEIRRAAVVDAQFKNVEALVQLGMLYMRRGNSVADEDGATDLARTKKFAQSALAVDDSYMPASNLLALLYLEQAKQKAGRATRSRVATNVSRDKKVDSQALELAALVCSQAIRKNPKYAPIHNTAGMIQVELGNLNNAVQEFNTARSLDSSFYEAQMNFAAINLQFRGFQQAEEAYRTVLKSRPNDYEARLGLALSIRGQIDDTNFDKLVAASGAELDAAKKVAPERAETYYNEAILTQEYKAKSGGAGAEGTLNSAKALFAEFIQKAGTNAEFADAVKRSKERISEIDQIIQFNKQSEAERKAAEAELKQKQAEAEALGDDGSKAVEPSPAAPTPKQ